METIDYLERLSKFEFTDEEKTQFGNEFDSILAFVDEISSIELPEGLEKDDVVSLDELRVDEPKPSMDRVDVFQNVPIQKDGCYVTPLVVE